MTVRRLVAAAGAALVAAGCAGAGSVTERPVGERLPIADLHFHPAFARRGGERDWGRDPVQVLSEMDRAGVRWAGNGAQGSDADWEAFLAAAPHRFLPFAGQRPIGMLIRSHGEAAWMLRAPEARDYLDRLDGDLRTGRFRGIGELFVHNLGTHARTLVPTRYPADSPIMRRLLELAVRHGVPLSIHMESDRETVAELERLLAVDREGIVIWAHCGFHADGELVRRLVGSHPNLLCELSYRDDRLGLVGRATKMPITDSRRQLLADWKALLEEHSDRFVIGTDATTVAEYREVVGFFRAVLAQLTQAAARRLAHENARRVFRLPAD